MATSVKSKTYVYTDGATVGHNGKLGTVSEVGIGVYIKSNLIIKTHNKITEVKTATYHKEKMEGISNNEAEFKALIKGMELCIKLNINKGEVIFKLDSKIVTNRANGARPIKAKWKNDRMDDFQDRVFELKENFEKISFEWVPREKNEMSDKLSKEACKLQV